MKILLVLAAIVVLMDAKGKLSNIELIRMIKLIFH